MSKPLPDAHDPAAAAALIKAIHRQCTHPLSKDESAARDSLLIDSIVRPIYLGRPKAVLPRRGPKPKVERTQYDVAFERRKGPYHRLVRFPASRKGTKRQSPYDFIIQMFIDLLVAKASKRNVVRLVAHELETKNLPRPSTATLYRILNEVCHRK